MENRERESKRKHNPVITFHTADPSVAVTFSKEESVGVKAVILDILTGAYRERIQKTLPYDKAG